MKKLFRTLVNMGISKLKSIRQGKHFEIDINEKELTVAKKKSMRCVENFSKPYY